jgi:hypothetical protein
MKKCWLNLLCCLDHHRFGLMLDQTENYGYFNAELIWFSKRDLG